MKTTLVLLSLTFLCLSLPGLARAVPAGQPHARANASALKNPHAAARPTGGAKAKGAHAKRCLTRPVQLLRVRGPEVEPSEVSLTTCGGAPNLAALDTLSVLGRPRDVERPLPPAIRAYRALPVRKATTKAKLARQRPQRYRDPAFVTAHVMRLDPGLLVRLQKIARRYPGRAIEIISGYRPDARDSSRHHHGLALDLRVAGIPRERLRNFLRTFEDTGVGFYPNSVFVHMDVRETKAYWIDLSGPGEPADYVALATPAKRAASR